MQICIPVAQDQGLDSLVFSHFGSAPLFMLVDTDSGQAKPLQNGNRQHAPGMCQPLATLAGQHIDAVVVGGIGMGALMKLRAANIEVYMAQHRTVAETLEAFRQGQLAPVDPGGACSHHGHGDGHGGCGH